MFMGGVFVDLMDINKVTSSVENQIETLASPFKPYLPILARFLLVVTFLEDTIRLMYVN